jgi:hypothetical protein
MFSDLHLPFCISIMHGISRVLNNTQQENTIIQEYIQTLVYSLESLQ